MPADITVSTDGRGAPSTCPQRVARPRQPTLRWLVAGLLTAMGLVLALLASAPAGSSVARAAAGGVGPPPA